MPHWVGSPYFAIAAASTLKGLRNELRYGDTILWRCVWPRNSSRDAGSADIGFEVAPRKREKTVAKMIALARTRAGKELGSSCTKTLADPRRVNRAFQKVVVLEIQDNIGLDQIETLPQVGPMGLRESEEWDPTDLRRRTKAALNYARSQFSTYQ